MTYSYSGGKLASVKDDNGHTITYRYTGSDLTSIVDETGVVLASYTYTSSLLATSTDRSGHVTRYEYYTDNRLKSLRDFLQRLKAEKEVDNRARKQIEKAIKRFEAKLVGKSEMDKDSADTITWDQMGVDMLVVDEFHCLPYGARILTDRGLLPIGEIVEKRLPVRVRSVDLKTNELKWMPVTDWFNNAQSAPMVRIEHESGVLECTANHKVWTYEEGYVEAGKLTSKHTLKNLPGMPERICAKQRWDSRPKTGSVPTLVAGILHDTVEDTDTTPGELRALFGEEVAAIVLEVTDDKDLPKAERKRLQVEHAPQRSHPARCVKLADKICNLRDVTHTPPPGWSLERRREYFEWAGRVVAGLRGAYPSMEELFDRLHRGGKELLDLAGAPGGE